MSVVTLERPNFVNPAGMEVISMVAEGDLDLITYLNDLRGTIKPVHQKNTFGFPTPKNPDKVRIAPQSRIEASENYWNGKKKKKLNAQDDKKSGMEMLEQFD